MWLYVHVLHHRDLDLSKGARSCGNATHLRCPCACARAGLHYTMRKSTLDCLQTCRFTKGSAIRLKPRVYWDKWLAQMKETIQNIEPQIEQRGSRVDEQRHVHVQRPGLGQSNHDARPQETVPQLSTHPMSHPDKRSLLKPVRSNLAARPLLTLDALGTATLRSDRHRRRSRNRQPAHDAQPDHDAGTLNADPDNVDPDVLADAALLEELIAMGAIVPEVRDFPQWQAAAAAAKNRGDDGRRRLPPQKNDESNRKPSVVPSVPVSFSSAAVELEMQGVASSVLAHLSSSRDEEIPVDRSSSKSTTMPQYPILYEEGWTDKAVYVTESAAVYLPPPSPPAPFFYLPFFTPPLFF